MVKKEFSDKQIEEVSRISIYEYVKAKGIGTIIHDGERDAKLSWNGHDSIVIRKQENYFIHNSNAHEKLARGNIINFVRYTQQLTFREAMVELLTFSDKEYHITSQEYDRTFRYRQEKALFPKRLYDYLNGERGIDKRLIQYLRQKGYIMLNKPLHVIFNWTNNGQPPSQDNPIIGYTEEHTERNQEGRIPKYIGKNSASHMGFNIRVGESIRDIYLFESSVDLLSYWTLHQDIQDARFVSLEGVGKLEPYYSICQQELAIQKEKGDDHQKLTIHLCVDNDKAGHHFLEKLPLFQGDVFDYCVDIPDMDTFIEQDYVQLKELSSVYRIPFEISAAIYFHDRVYFHSEDKHAVLLFNDHTTASFTEGLKALSRQFGSQEKTIDTYFTMCSLSQVKKQMIYRWANVIASETYHIAPTLNKDWNDVLIHEKTVSNKHQEWVLEKQFMLEDRGAHNRMISKQVIDLSAVETNPTPSVFNDQRFDALSATDKLTLSQQIAISSDNIDYLCQQSLILKDRETDRLVFAWRKNNRLVGASTVDLTACQAIEGSSRQDSFILTLGEGEPKHLYLCENPLDAISMIELYQDEMAVGDHTFKLMDSVFITPPTPNVSSDYMTSKVHDYVSHYNIDSITVCRTSDSRFCDHFTKERLYRYQDHVILVHQHQPIKESYHDDLKGLKEYQRLTGIIQENSKKLKQLSEKEKTNQTKERHQKMNSMSLG